MTALVPALAAAAAAAAAILLGWWLHRRNRGLPAVFLYLTIVLPFAVGGFHTYTAMVTASVLLGNLLLLVRRNNGLRFVYNLNSMAVVLLILAYCITPLWAADKGMAAFAPVRYLPVLLFALTLMQYTPEEKAECMKLLPITGAVMTVVSCMLLPLPNMERYLTVNGRLSGFLQYPNTFAIFLLAGLVLNHTKSRRSRVDPLIDAIAVVGVVLSGSRTGFLLLVTALVGIVILRKKKKLLISLGVSLGIGLVLAFAAAGFDLLPNADRFLSVLTKPQSLLIRLLYYKDALPVIAGNPFGLGYLGYRAMEGTFQTGRYAVSFVHNGFLQMLLDIGWIPTLLMAAAFAKALFSKTTAPGNKLLLFVLLGHCMLDFDLQFFLFWMLLLQALDFDTGKAVLIRKGKYLGLGLWTAALIISLWLGTGDLLHNLGYTDASLRITPFHTDALSEKLRTCSEPEELDALADRILKLHSDNSLAWSAKANAAFSLGNISAMMERKEAAIRCNPYATAEYCDYFEKLYIAMQMYLQTGDTGSASLCSEKLQTIPQMMAAVSEKTDALAYLTGNDTALVLPEEYTKLLQAMASAQ